MPSEEMRTRAKAWLMRVNNLTSEQLDATLLHGEVASLASLLDDVRAEAVDHATHHIERHCCVSTCCDAQPSSGEAKQLAECVRGQLERMVR